ncbi:MAG: hypothetical protein KGN84_21515 [Acidobacteriota bacterium]|nr:hypothetical protein [Acidobacteriota bacterium]
MLRIGVVRWRGKCSKHPGFDPVIDGPEAVRGACEKCAALIEIHKCHQKMLGLMRGFAPPPVKRPVTSRFNDTQESLF